MSVQPGESSARADRNPDMPSDARRRQTSLPGLPPPRRGKVRDVYDLGDALLIVATDRISAFDVVLSPGIPDKGTVLTQLSNFWFRKFAGDVPNHLVETDAARFPAASRPARATSSRGARVLVKKCRVVPFECVARGYLAGSGWKDYRQDRSRLRHSASRPASWKRQRLPEPIFTPATKAESGHDENVSFETMANAIGRELAARCATSRSRSTPKPPSTPHVAGHHHRRHEVRVRPRRGRLRRLDRRGAHPRLLPLLARDRRGTRGAPRRRSTSSSCGTGSRRPAGTRRRRRRSSRPTSSPGRVARYVEAFRVLTGAEPGPSGLKGAAVSREELLDARRRGSPRDPGTPPPPRRSRREGTPP